MASSSVVTPNYSTPDLLCSVVDQIFYSSRFLAATEDREPSKNHRRTSMSDDLQRVAQSVCRLVALLTADHSADLMDLASAIAIPELPDVTAAHPVTPDQRADSLAALKRVTALVLDASALSWGRIVSVLALFVEMCRMWIYRESQQGMASQRHDGAAHLREWIQNELTVDFGAFLDDRVGEWVAQQGGWSELASRATTIASPTQSALSCMTDATKNGGRRVLNYWSYAVMGMGIGTLIGFMAVR